MCGPFLNLEWSGEQVKNSNCTLVLSVSLSWRRWKNVFAWLSALCWGWFPCCTEFKFQESQKGTFPVYQRPFVWRLKKKGRKRKESANYCRSTSGKVIGRKFVCATWDMIVRLLGHDSPPPVAAFCGPAAFCSSAPPSGCPAEGMAEALPDAEVYIFWAGWLSWRLYEDNGYFLKI